DDDAAINLSIGSEKNGGHHGLHRVARYEITEPLQLDWDHQAGKSGFCFKWGRFPRLEKMWFYAIPIEILDGKKISTNHSETRERKGQGPETQGQGGPPAGSQRAEGQYAARHKRRRS